MSRKKKVDEEGALSAQSTAAPEGTEAVSVDAVVQMVERMPLDQQQELLITLSQIIEFDDVEPLAEEEAAVSDNLPPAGWLQITLARVLSNQVQLSVAALRSEFRNYTAGLNEAEKSNVRHAIRTAMASIRQTLVILESALQD